MAEKKEKTEKQEKRKLTNAEKILISVSVLAVVLLIGGLMNIVLKLTDPGPPDIPAEEKLSWLPMLENTIWVIDKSSEKTELAELNYSRISEIWFMEYEGNERLSLTLDSPYAVFEGTLYKDGTLDVTGLHLDLWYSEAEDGSYPTLTIKGKEEKLFFNPK